MQLKQLQSFVTVARTKNMAQTAEVLNYSHSTIYAHLESLEKEFNTKLYVRTSHGIELTDKGRKLLSYAKKFMLLYDETYSALSEARQSTLRIGASESGDVCFMHELLREFVRREPQAEIEYVKMTTDVSISKLLSGTCDVSFICEFDFQPEDLYTQYLGTIPLIFVCSPLTARSSHSEEDAALPTLLGTMKMPVAKKMLASVGLRFNDCFSSLLNIGDLDTIRQMLYYNRGIALLPTIYVEADLAAGELIRVPQLPQELYLDAHVVTASKSRIGSYTGKLIQLAFELFNPQHLTSSHRIF